jgi:DNA-binding NarL/FixJ family response regulator
VYSGPERGHLVRRYHPQDDEREQISRLTIDPASMAPRLRPAAKRSKASPRKAAKARKPGRAAVPTEGDGAPIALVLIDDNRLLREGIVEMVRAQPGFKVLAASADAAEALKKVREAKPDIVLVDFGLEDHDSLSLTTTVHAEVPEARVIVMGLLPLQEDVAHYVRAGASGFIMKDATFDEFFSTIRAVAGGAQVLPSQLTNSLFSQIVRNAAVKNPARVVDAVRLTSRERQVIDLLGEGLSNKEISSRLHIAVHTVKSHVHNVLEKLALHSRLEVAAFSHASGGSSAFSK